MRKQFLPYVTAAVIALALPAALHAQTGDIVTTAAGVGNLKAFSKALADAGLSDILKGAGPFTIFAPSDEAFSKLPPGKLGALTKDKSALKELLLYHVITGSLSAADIAKLNGKSRKTAEGGDARIVTTGTGITVNNATVIKSDIMATNGVIHVIDAVMLPPGS